MTGVTETMRFFTLLCRGAEKELQTALADQREDLACTGQAVFSPDEVLQELQKLELEIRQVLTLQGDRVEKLVGSLCV